MSIAHRVRLELRLALREGALQRVLIVLVALLGLAGYVGVRWQGFRADTVVDFDRRTTERATTWVADARRMEAGTLDSSYVAPNTPWFVYGFFPQRAILPPSPLSALSVGQSDLYAYYSERNAISGNTLLHEEEVQNPSLLALGRFDPAFFLVVVLPVLIIALAYDLVASDRHSRRDRILMLQAGSLRSVILRRAALRYVLTLGTILVVLAAIVAASARVAGRGPEAIDVGHGALLVALYAACWFGLAVVVNAHGASPTRNAVILLAAWGGSTLLAPAALDHYARAAVASRAGPLAPAEERRLLRALNDSAALMRLAAEEPMPDDVSARARRERGWAAAAELRRDTIESRRAAERQVVLERQQLVTRLRAFVPPAVLHGELSRLAGTTVDHMLAFDADAAAGVRGHARRTRRHVIAERPPTADEIARVEAGSRRANTSISLPATPPWHAQGVLLLWACILVGSGLLLFARPDARRIVT